MIFKKKQSVQKMIVLAIAMLCMAGMGWGENVAAVATVVGEYNIQAFEEKKLVKQMNLQIVFDGGKYFLKTKNQNAYTDYLIGCRDPLDPSVWYLWKNNTWEKSSGIGDDKIKVDALTQIMGNIPANSAELTVSEKMMNEENLRSFAYEISLNTVRYAVGKAARCIGLTKIVDTKIVAEPLPDGASIVRTTSEGMTGDIVLALYSKNGNGDALVFTRRAGMFTGEAKLFNSDVYKNTTYTKKALALQYEFFNAKGSGDDFKSIIGQLYGYKTDDAFWTLFSKLDAKEKNTILTYLATQLGKGLQETYREKVNEKYVFGGKGDSEIALNLYGDRRDIYTDAYLAYCFTKNRPVFASTVSNDWTKTKQDPIPYDYTNYTALTKIDAKGTTPQIDEGKELARAAMKYYTWGVEYTSKSGQEQVPLYAGNIDVYSEVKGIWFNPDGLREQNYYDKANSLFPLSVLPQEIAGTGIGETVTLKIASLPSVFQEYTVPFKDNKIGTPLPYAKNGIDSPRTFAWKMQEQLAARKHTKKLFDTINDTTAAKVKKPFSKNISNDVTNYQSDSVAGYNPFLPGGSNGTQNEAGVDALGFLTGSIAMTSFYQKVYTRTGMQSAFALDGYYKMTQGTGAEQDSKGKPLYSKEAHEANWSNYYFSPEDLEKCSVVVPDLSLLQLGDLVVQFGSPLQLGIVVGINGVKPTYGINQKDFMQNVIVVSVREGFRQVTLGTWGNPVGMFGGFTKNPEKCHVRRLLKRTEIGTDKSYKTADWDVCEPLPESIDITVKAMSEMDRAGEGLNSVKERWIPNTGEYLLLNDVRYSTVNKAGAVLPLDGEAVQECELFVSGAKDRGFGGPGGGNISINTGGNFEVALVNKVANSIVKLGVLEKNTNGTYTMKYCASSLYTDGGINQKKTVTDFVNNRLWVDSKGMICGKTGGINDYILAIRPENSKDAKPGDDLLLEIGMRKMGADTAPVATVATMKEADYIAVYDKKMLWRANLYIEQNEPELGNLDWNNVHPWNAPPDGVMTATTPKWWSVDYGNNEWNRQFSIDTKFEQEKSIGLAYLKAGDGKQVVTLPTFTPVRNLGGTNEIQGSVSYSYPMHLFEPVVNWAIPKIAKNDSDGIPAFVTETSGNPGSMDSPFDFVWKMRQQKEDIGANALDGKAPNNKWWDYVVTAPLLNANGTIALGTSMTALINGGANTVFKSIRYIPGLGLYLYVPGNANNESNSAEAENSSSDPDVWAVQSTADGAGKESSTSVDLSGTHKRRNASWLIESGTDCVGFVQRATSWRFSSEKNNGYAWIKLPPGMMEYGNSLEGNENPYVVMSATNNRVYPTTQPVILEGDNTGAQKIYPSLESMKKVVPGDIFIKTDSENNPGHIAIVAEIPTSEDYAALLPVNGIIDTDDNRILILGKFILIEAEYWGKIQSVIYKLSLKDYALQGNAVSGFRGKNIYPNRYSIPDSVDVVLKCKKWTVRRLQ